MSSRTQVLRGFMLVLLVGAADATPLVETPQFQFFGSADGMPSELVYALAQDSRGQLWIGTADGLVRYDGVEFEVFQHRPDAADSLAANLVQALHVDADDRVWVGSEGGGLSLLEPGSGQFRHFRRGATEGLDLDDVWAISSTADGAVWFGGYGGGLYRLWPDDGSLSAFLPQADDPQALSSQHVLALAVTTDGSLWIGGTGGLDRWTGSGFEAHPPGTGGPSAALIYSLSADPDGGLWIGSVGGLDYRGADGRIVPAVQREGLRETGVTAVLREDPDRLWIATRGGVHHWHAGRQTAHPLPRPRSARSNFAPVLALHRDHEGGIWFASLSGGLQRLPPGWRDFTVLRSVAEDADTLSSTVPRGLAEASDGRLWVVGGNGALDRLDPRDGRVERFLRVPGVRSADPLPDRRLSAVLETPDGAVWFGYHNGLGRFEPGSGALRLWPAGDAADAPLPGTVGLLIGDGAGGIWLSVYGRSIERRDAAGALLERYLPGGEGGLASADTEQLALGPDAALWLAGRHGLARRAAGARRIEGLPGGPDGHVHSFAFDGEAALWAHRLGALERYRITANGLQLERRVQAEDGLPAVESGGLLIDQAGNVWLTTRRGLLQYRPDSGRWRSYGVRDGLVNQEFVDRPALQRADGLIAAGTLDGLVLFHPERLQPPAAAPRLRLHRLAVLRDGIEHQLDPDAPIALRHDDRELHINARLASFSPPAARRYRFWLHGFDDDWIDNGVLDERSYARLPPGDYRLLIDAAGSDGQWSGTPIERALTVAPAWWQTLPAQLAQALLVVLALAALWQLQRRRLARRHAAELAERERRWALQGSEAKSRFLATLGHEIRTPMTGVLGMTELLLDSALAPRQRGHAEAIQRSGRLMLRLLDDALDLARIEAGKLPLEQRPFDLHRLLHELAAQQRPLAEARGLRFELASDPQLPGWRLGDPLRLQQVLLNLSGNAIKFTSSGFVAVRLAVGVGDAFELQVADSGPGLNPEQRARLFQRFEQADGARTARQHGGSGLGLAISQELVAAMGGRIQVDSEPGIGSVFRVQLALPLAVEAAAEDPGLADRGCAARRRVLLVEDDPTVAEVLLGLLAAQQIQAVHVPHGLAALGELAGGGFDAALLDLDLPGIDGIALARLLREQGHRLPLLALTARADPSAEPDALAANFDRFLRKPIAGARLAAEIAASCAPAPAAVE
jgi:signal transduction histidine kinase/ligand-binding sensor domain-containing protein/CheY-like chemotaxis protein